MAKEIDFAKAFEAGIALNQDLSPGSFSDLLNDMSAKTGQKVGFSFTNESKEAFRNKFGGDALKNAESIMSQSLVTNSAVNSVAGYFTPHSNIKQLDDSEFKLFFPGAQMTTDYKAKAPSIEFEWNGNKTPIAKLTTEQVADVNPIYFDSANKQFKPLNEDVIKNWSTDNWSLDNFSTDGDLHQLFGFAKGKDERVTLMRNEDVSKLDTEEGKKVQQLISLGQINSKDVYRSFDPNTEQFKSVWKTVLENEDPFDLNSIRSVWGPKTIRHNNYFSELAESFNDSFMSALDGAYFTTYAARKLTRPFSSPYLTESTFNTQLENEYNRYQQWSQGRRSTAAEQDADPWHSSMTNLSKGVANGVGQLIATGGVGFGAKLGVGAASKLLTLNSGKVLGGKLVAETLATMPANIARGFSSAYAMSSAQQEARRAGLSENESMIMAGLAGATLQLTEKMIGGNESWLYRSFMPKEVSSKAGKLITERVMAEAKLAGKSISEASKDSNLRSKILQPVIKFLTEDTNNAFKAGAQAFAQEAVQETSEDAINKINQFGFNSYADGLKYSGYDWVNDEARYKTNLKETLAELGGSFVIGGLTGAVSSTAMKLSGGAKDSQQELDGSKMNSLVHYYVDNKGNVGDYMDQLKELRKNDWTGNPYVSSEVDKGTQSRRLMDKITSVFTSKDNQPTKMSHTDYMYDVMETEANWVFNEAKKIEENFIRKTNQNPYDNAAAFGEFISTQLGLQPSNTPDVVAISKDGKINTLSKDSYDAAVKDLSIEQMQSDNIKFLDDKEAIALKKDLLVRDIQSSLFLEGMSVSNKKNDVQNKLALQLAKRNSLSLFSGKEYTDIKAFDGNYKGAKIGEQLAYEPEFDREFSENYNKLKHDGVIKTKGDIEDQNQLVKERRELQAQLTELDNKATRYGYESVRVEVRKELNDEITLKDAAIAAKGLEIKEALRVQFSFNNGTESDQFEADLRSLVEYEGYTSQVDKRVNYYKDKANFSRVYNESTFSKDLRDILGVKGGWSPYDYEDDVDKIKQAGAVFEKLDKKFTEKKKAEIDKIIIDPNVSKDYKASKKFFADLSNIDFNYIPTDNKEEVKKAINSVDIKTVIQNELGIDVYQPGDPSEIEQNPGSRKRKAQSTIEQLKLFNEETDVDVLKADYARLKMSAQEVGKPEFMPSEENENKSRYSEEDAYSQSLFSPIKSIELLEQRITDMSYKLDDKYFTNLQEAYDLKSELYDNKQKFNEQLDTQSTFTVKDLQFNQAKLIQDTRETLILDDSINAIEEYLNSTDVQDPKSYRILMDEINKILPRLYYTETQKRDQDPLDTMQLRQDYNYIVNSIGEDQPALRQRYQEILDNLPVQNNLIKAVALREELEKIAFKLEQAVSNRFIQDIDYQHAYIAENITTLTNFLEHTKNPKLDDLKKTVSEIPKVKKVIPSGSNKDQVDEYVTNTINSIAALIEIENEISEILTKDDYEKIVIELSKKYDTNAKAFLFRRFDDKGLKYKKEDLSESAQLERELNYLMLLNRGFENFYPNIQTFLEKETKDSDFIINFPQFLALRQVYSFGLNDTSPELRDQISEMVYSNIQDYQATNGSTIIDTNNIKELPLVSNMFNARGLPGVGKTVFLVKYFLQILKSKPGAKILVSAPKADQLKTIRDSLQPLVDSGSKNITFMEYKDVTTHDKLNTFDYIIIDESSLLEPSQFLGGLDEKVKSKILFSGDELQERAGNIYALYAGDSSVLSDRGGAIPYIMERGETIDTVVRSGNVDTAKYIDILAAYIPIYSNLLGRLMNRTNDQQTEAAIQLVEQIENVKVKPETSLYFEENGVVKKGMKVTDDMQTFINNIEARFKQSPDDFKVIVPTKFKANSRVFLKKIQEVLGETTQNLDDSGNLVITSVVSQGKTIKDVFVYVPDNVPAVELYKELSSVFVAVSRSSNSLVVYQPPVLAKIVPFTSSAVSNIDKVLTYPPFKIGTELSDDTKKRQDNFRRFINKINIESKEKAKPEEKELTDQEVLEQFFTMFNGKNIESYEDLELSFNNTVAEIGKLIKESPIRIADIKDLGELIKGIEKDFKEDIAKLTTATRGLLAKNLGTLRTSADNDSLNTLIDTKLQEIEDYEDNVTTSAQEEADAADEAARKAKVDIKKEWSGEGVPRPINIKIKDDFEDGFLSGVNIKIDADKITIEYPKRFTSTPTIQSLPERTLFRQALSYLAFFTAEYSVNYDKPNKGFSKLLNKIKEANPGYFKDDIDFTDLIAIRDALLIELDPTSKQDNQAFAARDNDLFKVDKLELKELDHRSFITQLILLSNSPQGQQIKIKPIIIPTDIMSEQEYDKIKTIPVIIPQAPKANTSVSVVVTPTPTSAVSEEQEEILSTLTKLQSTREMKPENINNIVNGIPQETINKLFNFDCIINK